MNADGQSSEVSAKSVGCAALFIAPFFLGGIAALISGVNGIQRGEHNARIAVLVGGVFLVVSTLMIIGLRCAIREAKAKERRMAEFPDEPWRWRADWADGFARHEGGRRLVAISIFALVWNLISWSALFGMWDDVFGSSREKLAGLVLIFPAVGIGLIGSAVHSWLRNKKFGASVFRMLTRPGVLGGTLSGAVEIPGQLNPQRGFKVRLLCVHRYSTGSGDDQTTYEDTIWESEKNINCDLLDRDPTKTGIPIFFNIPYEIPPTNEDPEHIWKLKIEAEVSGIDYRSEFHVPVFKTAESSPDATPVSDPTASFQPHGGEFQWPAESPIRILSEKPVFEAYFPPARNKGFLFGVAVFQAIGIAAIWFMVTMQAPMFFPIVFGVVVAIMLLWLAHMLIHSVRIHAGNGELQIEHRWLMVRTVSRFRASDVNRIVVQSNMSSGDKNYYCIKAATVRDETTLARGIPDKRQADWIAEQISDRLDILRPG